jgi:4-diphosphocytidyl-2-C-methyl-D-erythritol kinase
MPAVRLPAFAKINLCLDILGKRSDGYHELRTIFQTISLHDTLAFHSARKPGIELIIHGNSVLEHEPAERNLVYRAVDALRRDQKRDPKIRSGVRIELEKRIPAGRGLGGGSSDAAAALVGYARFIGRKIPTARLIEIAASLGADVPFFLFGGRALGVSRGDEIYPLPDAPPSTVLVVSPQTIKVPTEEAFRWVDQRLTKPHSPSKLWRFCTLCWSPKGSGLSNDFEGAVFERCPRLRAIKRTLLQRGAAEAALAGSGSAVFGIFRNPAHARRAAQWFPKDQTFVCGTLSRESYGRAMGLRGF